MPDYQTRLQFLYHRFISDKASPSEVQEFWQLLGQAGEEDPVLESIFKLYNEETIPESVLNKEWEGALEPVFRPSKKKPAIVRNGWWWAAASIALLIGVSVFFVLNKRHTGTDIGTLTHNPVKVEDVPAPLVNRATITLANGQKIFLDNTANGLVALQSHVQLKKTGDGKVVYHSTSSEANQSLVYNTLANPRGSKVVDIILSDGSHIWLNAGSSITFPVAFMGKERHVSMTGEAYFEVAHRSDEKFFVTCNGLTTEVLGTHFNVNAYDDEEDEKVTLLEGKVRVAISNGRFIEIKPGEQAVNNPKAGLRMRQKVNTEEVMAWKNNMFIFDETNIREVMKSVARWYGVEVVFKGNFQDLDFGGSMSRQGNVSELLKRLEATRAVSFVIEGEKITVIPTE